MFKNDGATTEATNGEIIYEAIIDMPYLNAIFRKTLSIHPQLSFLKRVCTKDHKLPPNLPDSKIYSLKSGDSVFIAVSGIQSDLNIYKKENQRYSILIDLWIKKL